MDVVLDVSRHQGLIDWSLAAERLRALGSAPRVAIRATVGDYYTDPRFAENWDGARAAGFGVTAYHVVAPECDPGTQLQRFRNVVGERTPDMDARFSWVLDCELTRGQRRGRITTVIAYLTAALGDPAIYTRASWWDVHVTRDTLWGRYPLWVANYGADRPTLPRDWSEWALWQYSADGNGRGPEFGMASHSVDLSYVQAPASQPPPPGDGIQLRVRTRVLNLRAGPGIAHTVIARLGRGERVAVRRLSVERDDAWVQVDTSHGMGWCALVYRGRAYLEDADD